MNEIDEAVVISTFSSLERRYDLDWLRIIAIFMVFVYHCTKFFDAEGLNIKNAETNVNISIGMTFVTAMGIPLFFLIAGMSAFYAIGFMEKRGIKNNRYVLVRFLRLLVPYFIGMLTYISILVYLEWANKGFLDPNTVSFFAFYPQYFKGFYGFGGNFSLFGHHLWFLVILFVISMILFYPFILLRKEKNRSCISKIASFMNKPGILFFLIIPIYIIEVLHNTNETWFSLGRLGGWDFISYIFFYIYGFFFAYDKQFRQSLKKNNKLAIILTVVTAVPLVFLNLRFLDDLYVNPSFHYIEAIFYLLRTIYAFSLLILIINLGEKFLNKDSKARKFLNELVLPFYIIHFVVVGIIGYFVVQLELSIIVKYLIILVSAFIANFLLLIIIREFNSSRFVFGMRIKKEKGILRFIRKKEISEN
ncbi:MAG: acyltransferase [Asgard group archaeon]|nr:acyltransferase [Asgard group archaeon]